MCSKSIHTLPSHSSSAAQLPACSGSSTICVNSYTTEAVVASWGTAVAGPNGPESLSTIFWLTENHETFLPERPLLAAVLVLLQSACQS